MCAGGFIQKREIDYTQKFAPVVRHDSLRTHLATVSKKDLELLQYEVQTAFMYGKLEEEIFMQVPKGLNIEGDRVKCVSGKLNKYLARLK